MALPGAWALLTAMRDCLCSRLEDSGRTVCACFVTPGAVAVWDFIAGDQAWVRLVNSYPSTAFPAPDSFAKCGAPVAWTVEVGVARCAPTPDAQGRPPTPQDQEYVAEVQNADMELMRDAIACCVGDDDEYEYTLGPYQPVTAGDGTGGFWTVIVRRV